MADMADREPNGEAAVTVPEESTPALRDATSSRRVVSFRNDVKGENGHEHEHPHTNGQSLPPSYGGPGRGAPLHTAVKILDKNTTMSGLSKKTLRETITVKFEEVTYRVVLAQQAGWVPKYLDPREWCKSRAQKKEQTQKQVLHGVSGCVLPGEVLAIMGPSGGGKTSFLNVMGGRVSMDLVEGSLTFNDQPYSKTLKRRIGFVTQDDLFYAHLTVRETLMYAAILRLPSELTRAQKVQRADETIDELGLNKCKDTIIGGGGIRGISGGERKRTSIGHEILVNPSLLLLDEPTSGLDATTALRIVQVLQNLARSGRTVVTTIHQPSSRLFHSFDKLLLLSEGNSVFFGKAADAMPYYENLGFVSEFPTNPADFILDLANGTTSGISLPPIFQESSDWQKSLNEQQAEVKQYFADRYKELQLPGVLEELHVLPVASEEERQTVNTKRGWTAPWLLQFSVLWTRGVKERRHEYLSPLRFYQVIALALICGLLWYQSSRTTASDIQDQVGFVFFLSIFWGFFPLFTAIFTFPQERSMLAKERASDMYRLTAYFMSRTLSDVPMELLLPTIFVLISYFMVGLLLDAGVFFLTLFGVYLIVMTAQGCGFFLGAAVLEVKKATTLASVLLLTFMLAGGYYLQSIPPFINWVKYVSFTYYAYRLLVKVQYPVDETFSCGPDLSMMCPIQDAPALRNIPLGEGAWVDVLALLAQAVLYRLFAYIALRRMKLKE